MQLTKNFTFDELRCPCGKCDGGIMARTFLDKLQLVRDGYGKAMKINSGFRCQEHNKDVDGAMGSMHLFGRAVDVHCDNGADRLKLLMLAVEAGMNGIGLGKTFIHLDDREDQALWTY